MRKAVFFGSARDFITFLRTTRQWLRLSIGATHHWVNADGSYGAARVEATDFMKEAV